MRWVIVTLVVCSTLTASTAEAQRGRGTGRMADRWQQRPLTLPQATLRLDIHEDDHDESWGGLLFRSGPCGMGNRCNDMFFNFGLSAGILNDLEIGALVLPLRLFRNGEYRNPQLYLLYRFLRGVVEMGIEGRVQFPVDGGGWFQVGMPFLIRAGSVLRLDLGFFFRTNFDNFIDLNLPFRLGFQISQPFYLGLDTGVFFHDFPDDGDDDVNVPIGMFFGYSIFGGGDPVVDILWGFRFVDTTSRPGRETFQGWVSARFNLYL